MSTFNFNYANPTSSLDTDDHDKRFDRPNQAPPVAGFDSFPSNYAVFNPVVSVYGPQNIGGIYGQTWSSLNAVDGNPVFETMGAHNPMAPGFNNHANFGYAPMANSPALGHDAFTVHPQHLNLPPANPGFNHCHAFESNLHFSVPAHINTTMAPIFLPGAINNFAYDQSQIQHGLTSIVRSDSVADTSANQGLLHQRHLWAETPSLQPTAASLCEGESNSPDSGHLTPGAG